MGLHICYDLRLPQTTTDDDAVRLLEHLRAHALTLGVTPVTPVVQLTGSELSLASDSQERASLPWLIHLTSSGIREERDGNTNPIDDAERLAAAAFLMHPGEGSESAVFGLVRPFLSDRSPTAVWAEESENWFWHYCCKTQYASAVSDEHLVHCHLSIVRMLEEAERIGFGVRVNDETHYWETRSTDRLISEVRNMNRIVARFAGALHDAHLHTEAPIFEDPDFERLETEPLDDHH